MTREQALEVAKANYAAYRAADIANLLRGGPTVDDAAFEYKHGWFLVDGFSFNQEEITGRPYDHSQGGWAYV